MGDTMIELFYIMFLIGCLMLVYAFRNEVKKMKATEVVSIVLIGMLVIGICLMGFMGYRSYEIGRDTTSWLDRAQVASNPEDMVEYLGNCRDGMDKWNVTDGYAAIIFTTPKNDMVLVMKALDRSIDRCEDISRMNKSQTAHQTALDDVRGQLRELDLQPTGRYWVQNIHLMIIMMSCIFIPVIIGLGKLFSSC